MIHARTREMMHPATASLHTVEDRVSFVYIDRAKVRQDATGVVAWMTSGGKTVRVAVPVAALAVILLGPGVSISTAALASIARSGAAVIICDAEGTRTLCWGHALTGSARWAQAQALLWADPEQRVAVAKRMYIMRFGEEPPPPHTLERLRGLEGRRMKTLYQQYAKRAQLTDWRRKYDPADFESTDPVNQALSAANACLYGVCAAAITGIGALPQLGFVHSGGIASFVHDIADLYKASFSVPVAFASRWDSEPASAARRSMRRQFIEARFLKRVVSDVQLLLGPGLPASAEGENMLLADDSGSVYVTGGRDWSRIVGDNDVSHFNLEPDASLGIDPDATVNITGEAASGATDQEADPEL